jgi:hypothetical protein
MELLAAAALQVWADKNHGYVGKSYVGEIAYLIAAVREARPGVFSHEDVEKSLHIFERLNLMTRSQQGSTNDQIRIDTFSINLRFIHMVDQKFDARKSFPLLYEYTQFGSTWLDRIWSDYFPEINNSVLIRQQVAVENLAEFAPASDRVVSLDHNQARDAEEKIIELVEALENDNGDPENPGLRQRLIGQFRAARELVRSGEYYAYLLYETLITGLGEIIQRYGKPAIVALANAFLGAAVGLLMQVG